MLPAKYEPIGPVVLEKKILNGFHHIVHLEFRIKTILLFSVLPVPGCYI